jgi:Dockerin type I domain
MWCGRSRYRRGAESRRRLQLAALEALEPRRLLSTDIVTTLNDSGAGSLRQTIAGAASGDTIQFASSLSGGTIVLTTGELTIGQNLTITGLGASNLSISGNIASTIFAISAAATVSISSLTLTDGNAGVGIGGGIYNDGSLTLTNCTLSADSATVTVATGLGFNGADAGDGGGIFNDAAGTLVLNGTTITSSRADVGGAIYNNGGHVTLTNSELFNSSAEQGGGLLNTGGGVVNITGSTITQDNALEEAGGGICNENSTLTITSSTVTSNVAATYGGGIANLADGTLTVNSTMLQSNTADQYGGGIFNFTGATVTINNNSTILSNNAVGLSGAGFGGGLFNYEGTANISGSSFNGNTTTFVGSGLADFAGTVNITGATFVNNGNTSNQAGGALYIFADTVTIASSTFSSNEAQFGGAIYQDNNSSLVVSASTLQNNTAVMYGGGAYISSTAFFSNSTIAGNQAQFGGGLISFGAITAADTTIAGNVASSSGGGIYVNSNETASLYNTIVATNTLSNHTTASDITGTLDHILASGQSRSSNNLIGTGGSGGLSNGIRGNIVGSNPKLGALQNNGGPTNTMALQTGSPAINAGSNALAVDANGHALTTDQRGAGFSRIGGGVVDIGAYEVQTAMASNSPAVLLPSPFVSATSLKPPSLLSNATHATPNFIDLGTVTPASVSAASAPYSPAQIVSAYGVNDIFFNGVAGNGTGQTIAIIDAFNDPSIISDANAFSVHFGLPQFNGSGEPSLTVLNQTGGVSLPGNSTPGQWDIEESLDVEWAHSIAPGANIILFEANSSSTADLFTAVTTAAKTAGVSVVSMSFSTPQLLDFYAANGDPELGEDSTFTTPTGHQGVTFFASTGDDGAPSVGYPALSPNVVAVGGTTLTIGTDGSYLSESAWSGGGGGTSIQEAQPSYQSSSINNTGLRATPDVSMDADPETGVYVLDSFDGGYQQIGGTSLSTPMWAGIMAIVDQGRALKGLSSLDGPTQTLPMLYNLPSSDFHDIVTGNNGYPATVGYDLATGLGTPNAALLVPGLAGYPATEIWTGAVSNDWYNPGNWNTDTVPGSTTNVIINFGSPTAGTGFGIGSLTINGGILHLGTNSGASTVTALSISGSGTLDVGNNHMFVDFSGADPVSTIREYLSTGYAGGAWNGNGIDTSDVASAYGVGYADGSDGVVSGLSAGQIEIKYTLYGDANLDGIVDGSDFTILVSNVGKAVTGWDQADFNYDGVVTGTDFTLLISNIGKIATAADVDLPSVVNLAATVTTVTPATTLNPALAAQPSVKIISARPFQAANVSFHPSTPRRHGKVRRV